MYVGQDFSDSDDDSLFSDDGDYDNYKKKIKNLRYAETTVHLTEEQKRQQQLNNLFNAISNGNLQSVIDCLNGEIDVNTDLRDGWTPLLLSVSYGNLNLTRELLDRGANVSAARDGKTALMMACNCPDSTSPYETTLEIIKLLIEKGADVKATNRKRMTALMFASLAGNINAVELLLPLSDKNAVDNQRWSALTWAVSGNHIDVVKFLLGEGLDMHLADVRGITPLDLAKDFNFEDILNLFPPEEEDIVYEILDKSECSFEDNFKALKHYERPQFFLDVCIILQASKCQSLIPLFYNKNVHLHTFLQMTNKDLKDLGVCLPFQRHRIQTGLYRFHKHPYHPKSIPNCRTNKECFSNLDVSVELLSAIKQITAMEAGLGYVMKTMQSKELSKQDRENLQEIFRNIKVKIRACKLVVEGLAPKIDLWDQRAQPPDLITKKSFENRFSWNKTLLFLVVTTSILYMMKNH